MLIPVQRKFQRQATRHTSSPKIGRFVSSFLRWIPIKFVWIFFILFALVYWAFLLLKNSLFASEYRITSVDYSLSSVEQYDNPYVYKKISTLMKGENYYVISSRKSSILDEVQAEFPFVNDIFIYYKSANKIFVKLLFEQPQMIMRSDWLRFGVYDGSLFQIYSWNKIWSWAIGMDVLSFASWLQMLTGIFYKQSADDLLQKLVLLKEWFPTIQSFSYLPWWQRIFVHLPNRVVYINSMIDIAQQIKNYQLLKRFYPDFATLKEVDLGSLESDKVIVKK